MEDNPERNYVVVSRPDELEIRAIIRSELRTVFAAALADPDVMPNGKSLAGYALQYLSRPDHEIASDRELLERREMDA
jgi:hypothetical protein